MPSFSQVVQRKLAAIVPPVGTSIRNPVDFGHPFPHPDLFRGVLEIVAKETAVDTLIVDELEMSMAGSDGTLIEQQLGSIVRANIEIPVWAKETLGKPLVMVLPVEAVATDAVEMERTRRQIRDYYLANGIPVYLSLDRAAKALATMASYYKRLGSRSCAFESESAQP